jgi:hypothetical protein
MNLNESSKIKAMNIKIALRDWLAHISRKLPYFKGKQRLGSSLINLLTNYRIEHECLRKIIMRDGSIMRIDLRRFEKDIFSLESMIMVFFSGSLTF